MSDEGAKKGGTPQKRRPRKLSDAQCDAIRFAHRGLSDAMVAKLYGVSRPMIGYIRTGKKRLARPGDTPRGKMYVPLPPDLLERVDLDVWFIRRGKQLLRGYLRAVERHAETGRFTPPDDKTLEVNDGLDSPKEARFGGSDPAALERAILARARKRTERAIAERQGGSTPPRQKTHKPDAGTGTGGLPAPGLLYDHKG